jgi:hypothetical protein
MIELEKCVVYFDGDIPEGATGIDWMIAYDTRILGNDPPEFVVAEKDEDKALIYFQAVKKEMDKNRHTFFHPKRAPGFQRSGDRIFNGEWEPACKIEVGTGNGTPVKGIIFLERT